jgi:Multidrug resistance efflux pump
LVASQEEVTLTKELPGRISAFMVSDVRPQVGGIIKDRLFEEGTVVEAGQVLYQIDPALYEAAYNNAKAELSRVQANAVAAQKLARRYSQLVATGAISKQEFDDAFSAAGQATAQVASAKEALETARINLGYTKVTAPVSGTIGRSFFTLVR